MPEISNKERGEAFEKRVQDYFAQKGIPLARHPKVKIGFSQGSCKEHEFDLGNENILVECKTSTWTESGNVPSAKITEWDAAMYYFVLAHEAGNKHQGYFAVSRDFSESRNMTLLDYYLLHNAACVPPYVTLIELGKAEKPRVFKCKDGVFVEADD